MGKNVEFKRNPKLDNCIQQILAGNDIKEVLAANDNISLTTLLNYCSNEQHLIKPFREKIAYYIEEQNPSLKDYLTMFRNDDPNKQPLDVILLGINDVAKQFRTSPDSPIATRLESEVKAIKAYKEPYKPGNTYGVFNKVTETMTNATPDEIQSTVTYLSEHHKDVIDTLGFIPDRLVSQYVRRYLEQDKSRETEALGTVTPPNLNTVHRASIIARIDQKAAQKAAKLKDIADLDKYIAFMQTEKGREV